MFQLQSKRVSDLEALVAALNKSQAVIEFDLNGIILTANENFLATVGYALSEIQGKHHSMFVDASFRDSPEYAAFWYELRKGEFQAARYKRFGKGGQEIWIEASYNPILGRSGEPYKVVKFATDITSQMNEYADLKGQVEA